MYRLAYATKDLYDSAVQKLLGELPLAVGLTGSLLDAPNKGEWQNITRPA